MISKLLEVATVGSTLASVGLVHSLLFAMAKIMILAIVSAFMLCALLAGVFYWSYFGLVHYGLDPYVAGLILGLVAVVATIIFVAMIVDQLRMLNNLPNLGLRKFRNNWLNIGNIAGAFIDGFLDNKKR